jgi:hypothetical protein
MAWPQQELPTLFLKPVDLEQLLDVLELQLTGSSLTYTASESLGSP